jgi:hypothetical protein
MCGCGKPTINGEPGAYSWDGKSFLTYTPAPPELAEGERLLYDEPGRCGGLDCHSHHFRIVKADMGRHFLLVRHGCGDERVALCCIGDLAIKAGTLDKMNSNERYWWMHLLYSVQREAASKAREAANRIWQQAAADKRIKTRKNRGRGTVKVWIEDKAVTA